MLAQLITVLGTVAFLYAAGSAIFAFSYTNRTGEERASATIVLTTTGEQRNSETIWNVINHHLETFPDQELYVVVDEGAALIDSFQSHKAVNEIVVPNSFDTNAIAKGRAQQYFVEKVVSDDEWYVFIDDDSLICDDDFLYEIPQYPDEYVAANGVLYPRLGESRLTYIIDHMRTFFDLWPIRATTGALGNPYLGFHGEFLLLHGQVLTEFGFTHESIAEDFVLADKIVDSEYRTWQSSTDVSILSPHTLRDLFKQRSRWLTGRIAYYPHATLSVVAASLTIDFVWFSGIIAGWIFGVIWFVTGGIAQFAFLVASLTAGIIFSLVYAVGVYRLAKYHKWRYIVYVLLIPLYATIEHLAAWIALLIRTDGFAVIDK